MKTFMIRASAVILTLIGTCWFSPANAMPSYARQTGLDCNSCHIGFENVPDFTRTGRLFIMRGFHQPNSIHGKFRETGFNAQGEDTPEYGGNYLALNWDDFLSARFISDFASGGANPGIGGGTKRDVTANPGSRFCFFFTGPVTDWLGVWTEIGYLGNNSIKAANTSTTAGQSPGQPTNLNLFAYDEYRLTASRMLSDGDSFIAMAYGNEYPDAINEFVFPVDQIRPWGYGQGGLGTEYSTANYSFYGFWKNSILTQYSIISGDADSSFSNGHNNYIALAYDGIPGTGNKFRRESNDMWWVLDGVWGNNVGSQVNGTHTSFVCSAACPTGISSTNFGFNNGLGYQWSSLGDLATVNTTGYETVDTSHAWRLSWHQSVADMGNHSWYQSVAIAQNNQDYVSGASSSQQKIGYTIRYFYNRTYGFEVYVNKALHYDYTAPTGVKYAAYAPTDWGISGLWAPAMNVNISLNYSPSKTPVLNQADYRSGGYSWSFILDYGF
jgi:hypothetical protein